MNILYLQKKITKNKSLKHQCYLPFQVISTYHSDTVSDLCASFVLCRSDYLYIYMHTCLKILHLFEYKWTHMKIKMWEKTENMSISFILNHHCIQSMPVSPRHAALVIINGWSIWSLKQWFCLILRMVLWMKISLPLITAVR